jgi:GxxExxY protein
MRKSGLGVVQQRGIVAFYDDMLVGEYSADLIVEDQVIVDLKVGGALSPSPIARNIIFIPAYPPSSALRKRS